MTPAEFEQARRCAVVELATLEPGMHNPGRVGSRDLLGLLVFDGLLLRYVQVAERRCAELVGPGGIVRPWDHFGEHAPMPFEVSWRVIEPVTLGLLTPQLIALGARWPQLIQGILLRAVERSHALALEVAIHSLQHLELRLLVLFWHLADRFGHVTTEGTVVPLRLTHGDIAELVGSQRPSVSVRLSELAAHRRLVRRRDRTWLLLGEPPLELRDMRTHREELGRGPGNPDVATA
jgi:CRP/FNR family transcriptional regulator, cyclic AMP receptor protein